MANEIRQPRQQRSIEKKNKIILAGYKLFAEIGYHNTKTPDIAKEAGVSTGIVYDYFKDKRDILLDVLDLYIDNVTAPIMKFLNTFTSLDNIHVFCAKILDEVIKIHRDNTKIHQVLHSLSSLDEDVNKKFIDLEDKITTSFGNKLKELNIEMKNTSVKIHLLMNLIQSIAHEIVYDDHDYIDHDLLKYYTIKMITSVFDTRD